MNNGDVASVATKKLVQREDYNCSGYNVNGKINKWRNVEYIYIRTTSEKVSVALQLSPKVKRLRKQRLTGLRKVRWKEANVIKLRDVSKITEANGNLVNVFATISTPVHFPFKVSVRHKRNKRILTIRVNVIVDNNEDVTGTGGSVYSRKIVLIILRFSTVFQSTTN